MSNFARHLKDEIARLARKEVKVQTLALSKTSAKFRKEIADLKKINNDLQKRIAVLERINSTKLPQKAISDDTDKFRFVPKGFKTMRTKLGLSAAEIGLILDVSPLSVYNWEHGKSKPTRKNIPKIIELRGMGKKEAKARLRTIEKRQAKAEKLVN